MITLGKSSAVLLTLVALCCGNSLRADERPNDVEAIKKELASAQKKIAELEKNAQALRANLEEQRRLLWRAQLDELFAHLDAEVDRAISQRQARLIEELRARLAEEKFAAPKYLPLPPVIPPLLTPYLRGKVLDVAGDFLTIDIGIDAGLTVGRELELDRGDGTKTIGTVKVTDTFNLYPKQAVVRFYPSRKVALRDLKPDELPKKGDRVRSGKRKD